MTHLLAFRPVDALEQGGDDAFLDREFGLKGGDLGGKLLYLLRGRFDG